tara:strand:+ start:373 stop:807 length:435 start_codon:yes stop_codon:yes gene_type:complete
MKDDFKIKLTTLEDTKSFAKEISKIIKPKTFISLRGKLGVGKTTLVREIINILSKKKQKVPSPTFSIVNTYNSRIGRIWHYDLYRIQNKNEIFNLDYDIALLECVIVEWPEIIKDFFPRKRIEIHLKEDLEFSRSAILRKINYD